MIVLYEHLDFKGKALGLSDSEPQLVKYGFNDIISAVVVLTGKSTLYEHEHYQGRSCELTPGRYNVNEIQSKIGNDTVSSIKAHD